MAIRKLGTSSAPWWAGPIRGYFEKDQERHYPVGYFRPSGISPCPRENQLRYMGLARYRPFDNPTMRRMERGKEHHILWEEIFVKTVDTLRGRDYPLKLLCPHIEGTSDWMVRDKLGTVYLIDLKSQERESDELKWGYLIQWNLYVYLLNGNYDLDIDRGWIAEENPVSLSIRPISMSYDEKLVKGILEMLLNIEMQTAKGIILPKPESCPGCNMLNCV